MGGACSGGREGGGAGVAAGLLRAVVAGGLRAIVAAGGLRVVVAGGLRAVVSAGLLAVVAAGLRAVLRAIVAGGLHVVVAPTPPYRHRLEVGGAECVDGDGVVRAEGRLVVAVAVVAPLLIPEGRGKTKGCAILPRTTVAVEPKGQRRRRRREDGGGGSERTTATALGRRMRRTRREPGWDGERGRERREGVGPTPDSQPSWLANFG